jgi:uncharacterized SAM-binding protein YcdF (DUF218 family)
MNSLLQFLNIESWKPVLTALAMPPVPFIVLMLVGARTILWRRGVGWMCVLVSAVGLWMTGTAAFAEWFNRLVLAPPRALSQDDVAALRHAVAAHKPVAIVVLGAGRDSRAPEYAVSDLTADSLRRLHYGVWLSRETGAPLAFSGGVGFADQGDAPEARVAARIAEHDFGVPLRWIEDQSRDTRESAMRTISLLRPAGIKQVLLVTHGWHMRRSLRNFEEAAQGEMQITAAPMGLASSVERPVLRWLPTLEGYALSRHAMREALGLLLT